MIAPRRKHPHAKPGRRWVDDHRRQLLSAVEVRTQTPASDARLLGKINGVDRKMGLHVVRLIEGLGIDGVPPSTLDGLMCLPEGG